MGFYELIEAAKAKEVFEVAGDACNRLCCCGLEITKIHPSYLIVQGFDELLVGCFWNCMAFWPRTVNAKRCGEDCDPFTSPMTPPSFLLKQP